MNVDRLILYAAAVALALLSAMAPNAARAQSDDRPSSLLTYRQAGAFETDGYMVGGEYWNTVKPLNSADDLPGGLGGTEYTMLLGATQGLQDPNGMWPGGYRYTQTFRNSLSLTVPVFKADGWPGYGPGNVIFESDGTEDTGGEGGTSRFMFAAFSENVAGADDPTRNYTRPARFTDQTRTHLVYEAGFPTTAGIDFRIRAHQFTPNTQNLNDFVVMEITMINTGEVDSDADGELEATGNVIDGVALDVGASPTPAIRISRQGDRGASGFEPGARVFGYVATPDESGSPYNLYTYWRGVRTTEGQATPPEGERAFGVNFIRTREGYTDIWNGWQFMGVKQGAIQGGATDTRNSMSYPSAITSSSPAKETLFGTHPIGEDARRGWYTSSQWRSALGGANASDLAFWDATAAWYEDYGKTSAGRSEVNLSPNSNFFSGGQPVDITTWTVGNPNARPDGDFKYASESPEVEIGISEPIWEEAWNPAAASGDFYGGVGYTRNYGFSEAVGQGVGPFRLELGEAVTVVWVAAAGYRFDGIADAVDAAHWAWERGWDIRNDLPVPAVPDVQVESTADQSTRIRWTDVEGIGGASVDGYKVWRAAQYKRTEYLDEGMRVADRYHHQHEVGQDLEPFKDPVNPYFSPGPDFFEGLSGSYQPSGWGDYELIAKIPASALGSYEDSADGYQYAYEDTSAITGFTYWYYVSAYDEGSFAGPQGEVAVGHIESSNLNRNGRNAPDAPSGEIGLPAPWGGTYPFADLSPSYPQVGTQAYQNMGAAFTVTPPVASVEEAGDLITVTPNPYKITGLNDRRQDPSSHDIYFLNMPEDFTLTIVDVTGQVIFRDIVQGASNGQYSWNMFSKDGIEVASGLYIYHVAYGGGREFVGHFAILR